MKWIFYKIQGFAKKTISQEQKFKFLDPGCLKDGELELELFRTYQGVTLQGDVPTYRFVMKQSGSDEEIGRIDLRVGNTERVVYYLGHIGYRVGVKFRGNRYAARATNLLLPLARRHGMGELWITCNPDNIASRRTCEIVGAELIETVDVPVGSDFYRAGEYRKCRYRLTL